MSAVTANSNDPADRHTTLAFRLAPDMVMLASMLPEAAWASHDIQGLLSSLAFSPKDAVVMPSFGSNAPIIAVPQGCAG